MSNVLPIVGKTVTALVPGYSLQVHLDADSIIQIEDTFVYSDGNKEVVVDPRSGKPDVADLDIVGRAITEATYSDGYDLALTFDSGGRIDVSPNRDGYESWHVTTPEGVFVGDAEYADTDGVEGPS